MFNQNQIICGKYKINSKIGSGGMGVVYNATHTALHREEALKVLHEEYGKDPSFVERFFREARAMARLNHENIVRVFDVFTDKGKYLIAMEHFKGQSLNHVMQRNKNIALKDALRIILQAARALSYAHKKGIVHRDIKPSNILVGSNGQVKLVDFGIAAAIDDSALTSTGQLVGSPRYMSPEQARGEIITESSDLFSLGMVLYQLITGTSPFEGDSGVVVIGKLAYQDNEINLFFPPGVNTTVIQLTMSLLKRKPYERIQSAKQLAKQLAAIISEEDDATIYTDKTVRYTPTSPKSPPSPGAARATHRPTHSHKKGTSPLKRIAATLAGIVIIFSGTIFTVYQYDADLLDMTQLTGTKDKILANLNIVDETNKSDQVHSSDGTLHAEVAELRQDIEQSLNQVIIAKSAADTAGARRHDQQLYTNALRQQKNALAKLKTGDSSIQQKNYDKAKSELLVAKTYIEEALNSFVTLQDTIQLAENKKQQLSVAIDTLKETKSNAQAARQQADQFDAKLLAANIYETASTLYTRAAASEAKATRLTDSNDTVNSALHLESAAQNYAQAASNFARAQELAQSVDLRTQVNATLAQLRKIQLDIIDATEKADLTDASQHAPAQYHQALNLTNALTNESLQIGQYIKLQHYADALSTLKKALPLASDAKNAFLEAQQIARNYRKTSSIKPPPSHSPVNHTPMQRPIEPRNETQPTSSDIVAVEQLLSDFEKAYEAKDINELKMLTDMSASRIKTVNQLFTQFRYIDISINNYTVTGNSASAKVVIDNLTNLQGHNVVPANAWKTTELFMTKDQGQWKKISWQ